MPLFAWGSIRSRPARMKRAGRARGARATPPGGRRRVSASTSSARHGEQSGNKIERNPDQLGTTQRARHRRIPLAATRSFRLGDRAVAASNPVSPDWKSLRTALFVLGGNGFAGSEWTDGVQSLHSIRGPVYGAATSLAGPRCDALKGSRSPFGAASPVYAALPIACIGSAGAIDGVTAHGAPSL